MFLELKSLKYTIRIINFLFPLIGECRVVTRGLESEKGCHSECFPPRNVSKNEAQDEFLCPFPLYLSAGYRVAYFQISLI